ncbi:hypothetical protein XELAEV_18022069mg [Xenopus laevis]|uniref:Uncharacterized protein n=1 Tax=Xenopus laevis TaxID=8355 RepID=A0A974HN33_XENLA|nr:hypothetical protein XELAEV_18022069mg [Xenopus laevis]
MRVHGAPLSSINLDAQTPIPGNFLFSLQLQVKRGYWLWLSSCYYLHTTNKGWTEPSEYNVCLAPLLLVCICPFDYNVGLSNCPKFTRSERGRD